MTTLFQDNFSKAELITNEYAYWNTSNNDAMHSPIWEMTSGSLFNRNERGWTGIPDDINPGPKSVSGTNSAVFRMTTKRADFLDYSVSFLLNVDHFVSTKTTPAVDWDGAHAFLRYQDEYTLYYASVARRDGAVVIKKKVSTKLLDAQKIPYKASDVSNGGVYYQISSTFKKAFSLQQDVPIKVTVQDNGTTVKISVSVGGTLIGSAIDDGKMGGKPILTAGKTGIRLDNCEASFDDFKVETL